MGCGREDRHVGADLGEDDSGGERPDPGDLIETGHRCGERGGQMGLDLVIDGGDVGVDAVDMVEHAGQQEPVMVVEVAVESLFELADLGSHP